MSKQLSEVDTEIFNHLRVAEECAAGALDDVLSTDTDARANRNDEARATAEEAVRKLARGLCYARKARVLLKSR